MTTSLDNSKRLYELSGWVDIGRDNGVERYTLEYLLERLPKQLPYGAGTAAAVWFNVKTGKWTTGYSQHIAGTDSNFKNKYLEADNPTDATALLCIKLFEQKILVKENNNEV